MNPLIQWHQRGQHLIQLGLHPQALIKEYPPTHLAILSLSEKRQIKKILPQIQSQGQLLYGHIDLAKDKNTYLPKIVDYLHWILAYQEQSALIYPNPPFNVRMHSSFCTEYLLNGTMKIRSIELFPRKIRFLTSKNYIFPVYMYTRDAKDIILFLEKATELGVIS